MIEENFQKDILNALSEILPFSIENVRSIFLINDKQILIIINDGFSEKQFTLTIQRHFE